jgi:hypothetical protein
MFHHSTATASSFSMLVSALIFSLSLAEVAWAQDKTSFGTGALQNNTTGIFNTAIGQNALFSNTTGSFNSASGAQALISNTAGQLNTASGVNALFSNTGGDFNTANGVNALFNNTTGNFNIANGVNALFNNTIGNFNIASGVNALLSNTDGEQNTASGVNALASNNLGSGNTASGVNALQGNTTGNSNTAIGLGALGQNATGNFNTAIGALANVFFGDNSTAIGHNAIVTTSNTIRLGNTDVTVIEGEVAFTAVSDKTKKENFQPVDGEEVLGKIRGFELSSWNFIGHDPKNFRHYGPMAQDFFGAFGHDGVGQIGSETTINSGDLAGILMIAVQALEKRTAELKQKEAQLAVLASKVEELEAKHAYFETVAARLEGLELRKNHAIQIAEKSLPFLLRDEY